MTHHSHCALRLGDNLAALQLIRKLAQAHPEESFIHACNFGYLNQQIQLGEMVEDLPNIKLVDLAYAHPSSVDLWKGANGYFYNHPNWRLYVPLMLDFYALCSVRLGLPCPIKTREDMLFDYPAIQKPTHLSRKFDWLVVNSMSLSGQFAGHKHAEAEELIAALATRYSVITTTETGADCPTAIELSVNQIGNLSLHCENILMVSTGPSWPTFNVWNDDTIKMRVILLDNERVELGRNTFHRQSWKAAHELLIEKGVL